MPSCIFSAVGIDFDVERFIAAFALEPYSVFKRGDAYGRLKKVHEHSGFKIRVSAEEDSYLEQSKAVKRFLARHQEALLALRDFPGVSRAVFDFGISLDSQAAMAEYEIDYDLSKQLGLLHINAIISVYLVEK